MARNDLGELRRASLVSTFGPGSVVDFRGSGGAVSGVLTGLETWDEAFPPVGLANSQTVMERRLQKKLGVSGFRLPPVPKNEEEQKRLVAVRFPNWLQCPKCDKIGQADNWAHLPGNPAPFCGECTRINQTGRRVHVIPVRFVTACENGHLDEFPWHYWVRHKEGCKNARYRSFLKLKSEGAGIAGLVLSCPDCNAHRSMEGIFSRQMWAKSSNCSGKRPWLEDGDEECSLKSLPVQRGASNLYFPVVESALSIPPWMPNLQEKLGTYWAQLANTYSEDRFKLVELLANADQNFKYVVDNLGKTNAELAELIEIELQQDEEIDVDDLRLAEYKQFCNSAPSVNDEDKYEFEIRRELVPSIAEFLVSDVVRAVRLRQVQAICGFTRINPPSDQEDSKIAMLSKEKLPWLPAVEVRGEGIFVGLDLDQVETWEQQSVVKDRVRQINNNYAFEWKQKRGEGTPPREISARFLLCHTLSHLLMKQLTLECGYSSSALQERLYADHEGGEMAGFLIYTATSDADGTLGGLQRQALSSRFAELFTNAIRAAEWCSSDPLCIENLMGAETSFSQSACHSCVLVPETACEEFNRFLDRGLVVGTPMQPQIGYCSVLLERF